jgi:hypothetical protein
MNFLEQNKTLVTIIALIAILYLLSRTQIFNMTVARVRYQWAMLGTVPKVVIALVIVYALYYAYNSYNTPSYY